MPTTAKLFFEPSFIISERGGVSLHWVKNRSEMIPTYFFKILSIVRKKGEPCGRAHSKGSRPLFNCNDQMRRDVEADVWFVDFGAVLVVEEGGASVEMPATETHRDQLVTS